MLDTSRLRIPIAVLAAVLLALTGAPGSAAPPPTRAPAAAGASATTDDAPPARDISLTVQLVRNRSVQDELALDAKQRSAVDALVAKVEYPLFVLRDLPDAQRRERLDTLSESAHTQLLAALDVSQQRRLGEIVLQAEGYVGLLHPARADGLGLSAEQQQQIRALLVEMKSDKATPESRQAAEARILKALNSQQQSVLAGLTGRKFDLSKIRQVACRAPELRDVETWINTRPLVLEEQQGRVVALHFWAFGCINCVRNLPAYQAWHERYAGRGLTVLGVHTPETERERDAASLQKEVTARGITYPVAADNKSNNWNAWANHLWPSVYLIDKQGHVRYWWYGELAWQGAKGEEVMRRRIEELLAE